MKTNIGVIEGFFGPQWSWKDRISYAQFIKDNNLSFYIYAPKGDRFLRKSWKEDHPQESWLQLQNLGKEYQKQQVAFGVGLSPYEIYNEFSAENKRLFQDKVKKLSDLGLRYLGLFFDDMKSSPNLASTQIELVSLANEVTDAKIVFCPTYYSYDPILEKVFGQMPENYLDEIGKGIDSDVDIMWTGEKVISSSITTNHLKEVSKILKRAPFLWDNIFANDGPRQCHHLKIMPLEGRSKDAVEFSAGWAVNPMNQANLSKLVMGAFDSSVMGIDPLTALRDSICKQCADDQLVKMIMENYVQFKELGLKSMGQEEIESLIKQLSNKTDPVSLEISSWLKGEFVVGSECLTD